MVFIALVALKPMKNSGEFQVKIERFIFTGVPVYERLLLPQASRDYFHDCLSACLFVCKKDYANTIG